MTLPYLSSYQLPLFPGLVASRGKGPLSATQRLGAQAEKWVHFQLIRLGYNARRVEGFTAPYDIVIGDCLPVEVKYSRQVIRTVKKKYRYMCYQFDLTGGLDGVLSDWVLVAVCDDGEKLFPYVLPGHWLVGRVKLQITSHPTVYSGFAKAGLWAWDTIRTMLDRLRGNG